MLGICTHKKVNLKFLNANITIIETAYLGIGTVKRVKGINWGGVRVTGSTAFGSVKTTIVMID